MKLTMQLNLFSDIPKDIIKTLSITDVSKLLTYTEELQAASDSTHKATFTLNGKRYGFIPSLEDITLGEYADIEMLFRDDVHRNLPELMAILYRPIVEEKGDVYTIEAYDGNTTIRAEEFKNMKAIMVQGALLFFWSLGTELLEILPSFLMELTKGITKEF